MIIWNSTTPQLQALSIIKGSFRDGIGILVFDQKGEVIDFS